MAALKASFSLVSNIIISFSLTHTSDRTWQRQGPRGQPEALVMVQVDPQKKKITKVSVLVDLLYQDTI